MKARILIVDDKGEDLNEQSGALKQARLDVEARTEFAGVDEIIGEGEIDCIHMDINFPNEDFGDGLDMLARLRNNHGAEVPVFIISAFIDGAARNKAEALGLSDYVKGWYDKPCDYEALALDTVRVINKHYFERQRGSLLRKIGELRSGEAEVLENALTTIAPVSYPLQLDPSLLLRKLRELALRIQELSDLNRMQGRDRMLGMLRDIATKHLPDYFFGSGGPQELLVDHLTYVIGAVNSAELAGDFGDALVEVIAGLENPALTFDDVYKFRDRLERTTSLWLGPVLGSETDVLHYLELIDGDLEEEE